MKYQNNMIYYSIIIMLSYIIIISSLTFIILLIKYSKNNKDKKKNIYELLDGKTNDEICNFLMTLTPEDEKYFKKLEQQN